VSLFRLAVRRAQKRSNQAKRLIEVIEHLGCWAEARVSTVHEGKTATYLLVSPARPVLLQAAKDIATTCPYYVAKSFKVLG